MIAFTRILRMKRFCFLIIFSLCFICSNVWPLAPSDGLRQETEKELQQEVTVTLKLIQVYVTDKKGNPVIDLEKEDFVLKDSGQIKKITDFEKHILTASVEKLDLQKDETPVAPPPRISRKFFLLFDFAFNNLGGINMAKALRYIPGYKHIILFSTGIPNWLMYSTDVQAAPKLNQVNIAGSDMSDLRRRYEEMARELTSANSPEAEVKLSARLVHQPTRKKFLPDITFGTKLTDKQGHSVVFPMELKTAELQPGKYYLYIFAEEIKSRHRSTINTSFDIEQ